MAVELRCPEADCRAKLRLAEYPDPGTEVECPKCGTVFPAPDPDTGEVPDARPKKRRDPAADADADRPRKTRKPAADDDADDEDKPRKKKKAAAGDKPKAEEKKAGGDKPVAKRRKAKKQETSKTLLIVLSAAGVTFLVALIIVLVWFFGRKPVAFEMMTYLPADCNGAYGLNVGHVQKYPLFFEKAEQVYKDVGFKKAMDTLAGAVGIDANDLVDYIVQGSGPSGGGLVIRTKKPFDRAGLAKLPGAREAALDGQKYYTTSDIGGLDFGGPRVFAPTDRLIVFTSGGITDATFRQMLSGNKDNFDATLPGRAGALGKRTVKGTFWILGLYQSGYPAPPIPKDDPTKTSERGVEFAKHAGTTAAGATGFGFKASVGSRAVRFEVIFAFRDAEKATSLYDKHKESDLAKADDAEPPRWWKDFANILSNKKLAQELLSNVGAKATGDLFLYYSECDTRQLMEVIGSLGTKLTGKQ